MLPESEQYNTLIVAVFMILSLSSCFYFLHKDNYSRTLIELLYFVVISTALLLGLEFIKRFYYFFDGWTKINSEHKSFLGVLKAAFSFNIPSAVIVSSSIFFFLFIIYLSHIGQTSFSFCSVNNLGLLIWEKNYQAPIIAFFLALCFSFLLLNLVNMSECRAENILVLHQLGGLDYGSSMAINYFYGYLKIILPSDGKNNIGFLGRIENFEANQGVTVPIKKLFILIPTSFYIPPNLKESSQKWLEAIPNRLEYIQIDRAGSAQRVYKNTVYKIHPGGLESGKSPVYVVTEGATPMLTFFEVQQRKHKYSDTYTEYKREIGRLFYRTLEQLLNDNPDCRYVCELVYYEDYDENGKPVNPAEILLKRIQEQSHHRT